MNLNLRQFLCLVIVFLVIGNFCKAQTASIEKADSLYFAKNWKKAKTMYENVLKDTSRNSLAWNRLGFSNHNLKNYDVAFKCYQKSLVCNPNKGVKSVVFSRIARIYALKGEKQKALADLDSAVTNGFGNIAELDTVADFKNIRDEKHFKDLRNQAYGLAFPCMVDPHVREFDFWVGSWDVYQRGTKTLVGHNTIEIIADGCALLENWTNLGNRTGKSINFIDPDNKWKQTWVGGGNQEFVAGEYKDGAMRFRFQTVGAQGNSQLGRFIFYNEGPNQVRQFNETSSDNGKTWVTSYDFTYIRKK